MFPDGCCSWNHLTRSEQDSVSEYHASIFKHDSRKGLALTVGFGRAASSRSRRSLLSISSRVSSIISDTILSIRRYGCGSLSIRECGSGSIAANVTAFVVLTTPIVLNWYTYENTIVHSHIPTTLGIITIAPLVRINQKNVLRWLNGHSRKTSTHTAPRAGPWSTWEDFPLPLTMKVLTWSRSMLLHSEATQFTLICAPQSLENRGGCPVGVTLVLLLTLVVGRGSRPWINIIDINNMLAAGSSPKSEWSY